MGSEYAYVSCITGLIALKTFLVFFLALSKLQDKNDFMTSIQSKSKRTGKKVSQGVVK